MMNPPTRTTRRFFYRRHLLAGLVVTMVLASCSGDDDVDGDVAVSVPPPAVVEVDVNPGTSEGYEGALEDVSDLACEQRGETWEVEGIVTNSSPSTASYRIYVSMLDGDRFTRGLLQVNVDSLDSGESTEWAGEIAVSEPELDCILRVERTADD
jgi:hypothetical protein